MVRTLGACPDSQAKPPTKRRANTNAPTYDLVAAVRSRRYKWLGHILRLPGPRLVKLAVQAQYEMNLPGNICMDAPITVSFEELTELAQDRKGWAKHWEGLHLCRCTGLSAIPTTTTPLPTTTTPAQRGPITATGMDLAY